MHAITYSDTLNPDIAIAIDDDYVSYWFFDSVLTGYKTLHYTNKTALSYADQQQLAYAGYDVAMMIIELGALLVVVQSLGQTVTTADLEFEGTRYLTQKQAAYTGEITDNIKNYLLLKGKHAYLTRIATQQVALYSQNSDTLSGFYAQLGFPDTETQFLTYTGLRLKSVSKDHETLLQAASSWRDITNRINDLSLDASYIRQSEPVMRHQLPVADRLNSRNRLEDPAFYYDKSDLIIIRRVTPLKYNYVINRMTADHRNQAIVSLLIKKALDYTDTIVNSHYSLQPTTQHSVNSWLPPLEPATQPLDRG